MGKVYPMLSRVFALLVAILSRGYKSEPRPILHRLWQIITFQKEASEPRVVSDGQDLPLDSTAAGWLFPAGRDQNSPRRQGL